MAEETKEVKFNLNDLTLGELCDLEEVTGLTFDQMNFKKMQGKLALALLWIVERRKNPKFTLAEAKNTKVIALTDFLSPSAQPQSAV